MSVPFSVTLTLPVGVPPVDITWKLTVNCWPRSDGSGSSWVMVVVVDAGGGGGAAVTM